MSDDENVNQQEEFDEEEGLERKPPERSDNEILGANFHSPLEEDESEEEEVGGEEEGEEEEKEDDTEEEAGDEEESGDEKAGEEEEGEEEDEEEKDALDSTGKPLNEKKKLSEKVRIKVNDEVQEVSIRDLVKDAQRARAADAKFQQAAGQTKQALQIIKNVTVDPLATFYHLVATDKGDTAAYEELYNHCAKFIGAHMEFESLPPEEKAKRQAETAIARKDREIERLKSEKEQETRRLRGQMLARQIRQEALAAGLPDERDTLMAVCRIFDEHEQRGENVTAQQCVKEFIHQTQTSFTQRLGALSDDELKKHGFVRAKQQNGDGQRPGRAMRVRKRPASTGKAKPKRKKKDSRPRYYNSYREAWEAEQAEQAGR